MFKYLFAATLIWLPISVQAQTAEEIAAQIKSKCSAEWGTDYSMVEYCQTKQYEAAAEWLAYQSQVAGEEILTPVMADCDIKWADDYSMKLYCFEKQLEALDNLGELLNNDDPAITNILMECMGKWDPDYSMVEYCANKQVSAYKRLNR